VGRLVALLAAVLIFANAHCFVRCDLDSARRTTPPCHAQTKLVTDHCLEQHDSAVAPSARQAAIAHLQDFPAVAPSQAVSYPNSVDPSPPRSLFSSSLAPLRI